ncbi:hypothetical protein [Saccharopolyspora sp. NPDC050642]|uniref:hypothetical protein n=1 Tax=Saccharopolyspora sp. NPDC050642 TaxID=3157099 RepID=UPI0033FD58EB
MSPLADITADLATWLTEHAGPELPPIVGIRVGDDAGARLQLPVGYDGRALTNLADWAEHLDTGITVKRPRTSSEYLRAEITTSLRHGQLVTLWDHLEGPDCEALEAACVLDPVEPTSGLTAADLRRAAGMWGR